jgi:hypothetical protein
MFFYNPKDTVLFDGKYVTIFIFYLWRLKCIFARYVNP